MHCQTARKQLQLYIDERLTLEQMRNLEAHVARCADCREELAVLEEISSQFKMVQMVAEPENMHAQIMQRVALTPRRNPQPFFPWRPTLAEWLAAILLATVATLGSILAQPSVRALLPFANGHDSLSIAFMNLVHNLLSMNTSTLTLVLWVFGTLLGICITLAFAGSELRSRWFKAMLDRLPVR
jgi:predicted anti-sigma-YlaC factor YlaD